MDRKHFKGTVSLLRLMLRRDWLRTSLWVGVLAVFGVAVARVYPGLYPGKIEREAIGAAMENPAMVAMFGKVYGLSDFTVGALYANQMFIFMLVFAALMNVFLIATHTRGDEESGVSEMMRGLPVGRVATLFGVFLYAALVNGVFGLLMGTLLFLAGDASMDGAGSLLFGFSMSAIGLFFAGLTAFFAQLFENTRTVRGMAFLAIGILYMMRAVGDVSLEVLSFMSPFGLLNRTQVYVENHAGFLFVVVFLSLLLFLVAFKLSSVRDHGSGMLKVRSGKKEASAALRTPLGLAFKLTKTLFIVWAVALFLLGASYGSIFGDIDAFFEGNEQIMELIPGGLDGDIGEQFMSTIMAVMMVGVNVGAMMIFMRLVGEEKNNRTESLYALPLRRFSLFGSYMILSLLAALLFAFTGVFGMLMATYSVMDTPFSFFDVFQGGFTFFPAVLFMMGLGAVLAGWWPRRTNLAWIALGVAFVILYFGPMLDLPEFFMHLSPFEYMPRLPVEEARPLNAFIMSGLAAGLFTLGFIGYERRDLIG
ncbi:MAG: ABC transporter permease [Bacillota bacterium]